jgi:hypothetical protein
MEFQRSFLLNYKFKVICYLGILQFVCQEDEMINSWDRIMVDWKLVVMTHCKRERTEPRCKRGVGGIDYVIKSRGSEAKTKNRRLEKRK